MKKVVFKVHLHDDRIKQKAMKAACGISGVELVSVDMKEKKLTLVGYVDTVHICRKLRKLCHVDIVFVGHGKVPEAEEEKKKKESENSDDKKKGSTKVPEAEPIELYDQTRPPLKCNQYHWYCVDEGPNICVICEILKSP